MTTETIGQKLARARLLKGVTLRQAYADLHIREKYLLAMEEDRPEDLPSTVQGRGFIRLYWEYLDLPDEELDTYWRVPETEVPTPPAGQPVEVTPSPDADASESANEAAPPTVEAPTASEPSSTEQFKRIGAQLRERRRRLTLSLESIEQVIRIPMHYLRALEEGRLADLPSAVQARGMLQNYADYMDMDVEDLLLAFADALQTRRQEENPAPPPSVKPKKRIKLKMPTSGWWRLIRNVISLDVLIIIGLALVTLIILIWGGSRVLSYRVDPQLTQTAESEFAMATAQAAANLPAATNTLLAAETSTLAGSVEEPTATLVAPTRSGAPIQLFVVARQQAYLQVIVDGKTAFVGRVKAGTPYYYEGKKRVELICGNASAIQIIYNQLDLGNLGPQGTVVDLIFSENGFGAPTLTVTTTPTATLRPSRTPIPSNTYPPTHTKQPTSTQWPTRTPTPSRTPTP
jgi:cytoskeletal protein RodZ